MSPSTQKAPGHDPEPHTPRLGPPVPLSLAGRCFDLLSLAATFAFSSFFSGRPVEAGQRARADLPAPQKWCHKSSLCSSSPVSGGELLGVAIMVS